MLLGPNLNEPRRPTSAFNVLTTVQPAPFPGSPDDRFVPLQAVFVRLPAFVLVANVKGSFKLDTPSFYPGSDIFLLYFAEHKNFKMVPNAFPRTTQSAVLIYHCEYRKVCS